MSKAINKIGEMAMDNKSNNDARALTMNEIVDRFSAMNVNKYLDKKGRFDYLQWGVAWWLVKTVDPAARFEFNESLHQNEVTCEVTIHGHVYNMHLPILDFNNKVIANPSAFDVNSAKMRCLVKNLAVNFGLGMYVYTGHKLPQQLLEIGDATSVSSADPSAAVSPTSSYNNAGGSNLGVSSAPSQPRKSKGLAPIRKSGPGAQGGV